MEISLVQMPNRSFDPGEEPLPLVRQFQATMQRSVVQRFADPTYVRAIQVFLFGLVDVAQGGSHREIGGVRVQAHQGVCQ